MAGLLQNFLEQELHELEAADPQMRQRLRARFWIILSAIPIVPISVLNLIVALLSWDHAEFFPSILWTLSLLHPFLCCMFIMIAAAVHKQAAYRLSMCIAIVPQTASFVAFVIAYIMWALDLI